MKRQPPGDNRDLTSQIEALLEGGESLLWWDKVSDNSIMGAGKTLTWVALAVNLLILLLIFAPALLPGLNAASWLLLPLLIVDCICLLYILLYFAFGLMTDGVNAITSQRVLVADLRKRKIKREMRLASLSAIKIKRRGDDRGRIVFYRQGGKASARQPRRLSLDGIRQFSRVLDLLRELSELTPKD